MHFIGSNSVGKKLAVFGSGLISFLMLTGVLADAPVIDLSSPSGSFRSSSKSKAPTLENRVQKLERILANQTLIDLTMRLDSLQQELAQVVGQMEEAQHQLQGLKDRQRELYLDIDRRLQQLEKAATTGSSGSLAPSSTQPGTTTETPNADPQARVAYQKALNVLREGNYSPAIKQFAGFLKKYPNSEYSDDAQYWMGDALFVQRSYDKALKAFDKVIRNYPDSAKYPDALLKIGLTHVELGNMEQAKKQFKELITRYPNTPESRIAERRLQQISVP